MSAEVEAEVMQDVFRIREHVQREGISGVLSLETTAVRIYSCLQSVTSKTRFDIGETTDIAFRTTTVDYMS